MFEQLVNAPDDDDEAAHTASQCLRAIGTVLWALHEHPETYATIEPVVQPMLVSVGYS